MTIIKKLLHRHNIVLQKGQHLHIFTQLIWNHLLLIKLKIFKVAHGILHPIVHYYAVCWNEEKILPFMFDYYDKFVDHYTIYDNYSNDNSISLIKQHSNTKIILFGNANEFNDKDNKNIKNNCWKHSRGKADFVVVCDIDEFLYHPEINKLLNQLYTENISFPTTKGYEMYSDTFPVHNRRYLLTDLIQKGVRSEWLDKHILFNPHKIVETNFAPGAHQANPTGIVKYDLPATELKVLHYKNIGLDYLESRYRQLGERLSSFNREKGLGLHYLSKQEEIEEQFTTGLQSAENVVNKILTI